MKTETIKIEIQRFTDDDGNPICDDCEFLFDGFHCPFSDQGISPGNESCPVWNNTVKPKWATFEDWLKNGCSQPDISSESLWRFIWDEARKSQHLPIPNKG